MGISVDGIGLTPRAGAVSPAEIHTGQARFAYRLAESHRDRLLFVFGLGWHYWDGKRWALDDRGEATRAVLRVLEDQWGIARHDKSLAQEIRACDSSAGIRGILEIAGALEEFAARVDDLDSDPYLLNCANGTLDLRTMQLYPPKPSDRLTKVTTAAYTPGTTSRRWSEFLDRVLPDTEVRDYLARFVGVALIGAVKEQHFTIATGTGANGKGVFYGAVLNALGDYGHTAESDLFMTTKANANAASPAIVALRGKRFVVTSETERDHKLAAALMKNLTGGDPINARAMYSSPIVFKPSHTVLMVTNFLPKVSGNDPAVWRRMRVVPFRVEIPPAERDPHLGEDLELDADAILAWAVDGYCEYVQRGMEPPAAVLEATNAYQERSDAIARFLNDCCLLSPHMRVGVGELFEAWQRWASEDGAEPVNKNQFGEELDKRGFETTRTGSGRFRKGLGLAALDTE